jgi:glycosyltransferase involved in cell wall biosynthesis
MNINKIHKTPDISLVICTKNRAEQLKVCLASVDKLQTSRTWELVIIDNNSNDHTQQVISDFKKNSTLLCQNGIEKQRGLGAARNAGWALAKGNYISFIDDDCYPQVDFIEMVATIFDENPVLGFTGGRVLLFDPTDLPITIQTLNEYKSIQPYSYLAVGLIHGANFSFRRAALEAAGGFDPLFGAGQKYPCEDVDTMAEVLRKGWHGNYDPRTVVFHHHKRKLQADADKLAIGYDIGRGAYFAKRILKSGARKEYLLAWLARMRWQPGAITRRELAAALQFWADSFKRKFF